MTTWGDLCAGDVILDKTDVPWTVGTPQQHQGTGSIRVALHGDDGRMLVVVKPASEPVTLVRPKASVEDQANVIRGVFPEAEVIADEPGPEVLPHIPDDLSLRSHLLLLHAYPHYEQVDGMMLGEHHRKCHELEAEGKGEKGYVPHVHEDVETTVVDKDGFGRTVMDDGR